MLANTLSSGFGIISKVGLVHLYQNGGWSESEVQTTLEKDPLFIGWHQNEHKFRSKVLYKMPVDFGKPFKPKNCGGNQPLNNYLDTGATSRYACRPGIKSETQETHTSSLAQWIIELISLLTLWGQTFQGKSFVFTENIERKTKNHILSKQN